MCSAHHRIHTARRHDTQHSSRHRQPRVLSPDPVRMRTRRLHRGLAVPPPHLAPHWGAACHNLTAAVPCAEKDGCAVCHAPSTAALSRARAYRLAEAKVGGVRGRACVCAYVNDATVVSRKCAPAAITCTCVTVEATGTCARAADGRHVTYAGSGGTVPWLS